MSILIQWSDEYSIDARLDGEHQRLFELANTVFAIEDPNRQLAEVKDAVNALHEYLKAHFGNEESFMELSAYPEYGKHVALHKVIIKKMNQLMTCSSNLDQLLFGLRHLMIDWVTVHIMQHDRKLGAHLRLAETSPASDAENLAASVP